MSVTLQNPYARIPGRNYRWLKGNLHHHSTRSDGSRTPQGAVDRYAGLGYSVLAITDHDVFSDYTGVDPKGMILLPGVEHSTENVTLANGVPTLGSHVLQIGGTAFKGAGEQQVIDQINAVGGLAVLNHPGTTSTFEHFPMEVILGLSGYIGLEVFNGTASIRMVPPSPLTNGTACSAPAASSGALPTMTIITPSTTPAAGT